MRRRERQRRETEEARSRTDTPQEPRKQELGRQEEFRTSPQGGGREGGRGDSKRVTTNLLEHFAIHKVITHVTCCLCRQPHRDAGPDQGAMKKNPTQVSFKGARMLMNMKKKKSKGERGKK